MHFRGGLHGQLRIPPDLRLDRTFEPILRSLRRLRAAIAEEHRCMIRVRNSDCNPPTQNDPDGQIPPGRFTSIWRCRHPTHCQAAAARLLRAVRRSAELSPSGSLHSPKLMRSGTVGPSLPSLEVRTQGSSEAPFITEPRGLPHHLPIDRSKHSCSVL